MKSRLRIYLRNAVIRSIESVNQINTNETRTPHTSHNANGLRSNRDHIKVNRHVLIHASCGTIDIAPDYRSETFQIRILV